jgi:hypothetical protein
MNALQHGVLFGNKIELAKYWWEVSLLWWRWSSALAI